MTCCTYGYDQSPGCAAHIKTCPPCNHDCQQGDTCTARAARNSGAVDAEALGGGTFWIDEPEPSPKRASMIWAITLAAAVIGFALLNTDVFWAWAGLTF